MSRIKKVKHVEKYYEVDKDACSQTRWLIAIICKFLDLDDDPHEIYNKIEEDWNGRTFDQGTGEQT